MAQSRWMVRSDTPRMAAISANVSPQKNLRSTSCANALQRVARAHVVDDQAAHGARRVGEEVLAVGERQGVALRDLEIRLVQQRGRAERHMPPGAMHM